MNHLRSLFLAMTLCFSDVAGAQHLLSDPPEEHSAVKEFVYGEAFVGLISYLASKNPRAAGTFLAVSVPLVTLRMSAEPERKKPLDPWLYIAGAGVLAVYDLRVDKTRASEREIFITNFAWLNAVQAIELTADNLGRDRTRDRKISFAFAPAARGGTLFLTYRF